MSTKNRNQGLILLGLAASAVVLAVACVDSKDNPTPTTDSAGSVNPVGGTVTSSSGGGASTTTTTTTTATGMGGNGQGGSGQGGMGAGGKGQGGSGQGGGGAGVPMGQ